MASSRALSHGFWTKSRAPRRIASTATSTLPQAVITTTGSVGSMRPHRVQEVEPLLARGRVARVVEVHQEDVELLVLERGDDAGRRGGGVDLVALGLEQQPQRLEHVGLIVGDEQPARRRRGAGALADLRGGRDASEGCRTNACVVSPRECYSLRRACAGSTARARRTGSHIARRPRRPSTSAAPR